VSAEGIDRRRVVAGGVSILVAVLGYAAVQAVIGATSLPDEWIVLAMPVFGVVGIVGLATFVSGALGRPDDGQ
jgi:hypothetical protein